jgi:uncharacterized protein YchJ
LLSIAKKESASISSSASEPAQLRLFLRDQTDPGYGDIAERRRLRGPFERSAVDRARLDWLTRCLRQIPVRYKNSVSRRFSAEVPELADPLPLAQALLELDREVFGSNPDQGAPRRPEQLERLARLASELAAALNQDMQRFAALDRQLSASSFAERLLELPLLLAEAGEEDSALGLSRALAFIAPDTLRGDEALILARAGRREEALLLVTANLERAQDIPSAEAKAGDVYRALGEADSAEAYYRRSLAESQTSLERSEALVRLVGLLCEIGREQDASVLLQQEQSRIEANKPAQVAQSTTKVGRNEPCPCGSGKKYKKCHGVDG